MKSFSSFLNKKDRENKEHLHTLFRILEKAGFQVDDHLDDTKEPYIYVRKPSGIDPVIEHLSFGGVRIYTRGKDIVCYRPQNKHSTEPFGTTYQLDIEGMFKDLVKEEDKKLVGNRIIFYIIKELKNFFIQSAQAEREEDVGNSQLGAVVMSNAGTDYANQVQSNDVNRRP